jgi:hypothetical protein
MEDGLERFLLCQTSGTVKKYHERICKSLKGERQKR